MLHVSVPAASREEDADNEQEDNDKKVEIVCESEQVQTDGQESDEDNSGEDGDPDQQKAGRKRASMRELDDLLVDQSLGELLSESKAIKRKRERAKLAKYLGDVEQQAHYYELYDHMKTDMARQLLTVSKVNSRTTEIQLKLIDKLQESLTKNTQQQTQIVEKDNWVSLGTEALRTITELGKTALTSRAVLSVEAKPTLPALPAKTEDTKSEAFKEAAEAKAIAKETRQLLNDLIEVLKTRPSADAHTKPSDEAKPVEPAQKAATPDAPQLPPTEKHPPSDQTHPPSDQTHPPSDQTHPPSDQTHPPKDQKQSTEPHNKDDKSDDPPPTASPTGSAASASVVSASKESSPSASKSIALARHPDPFVQSWRSIKRLLRRMTDTDFFAFTSSPMMFRGFLAMLRALTPYYTGPTMSFDELAEVMPMGGAMPVGGAVP